MVFIITKICKEITEWALVPYIKEKIIETGGAIVPWAGVFFNEAELYKESSFGLTSGGGVSWLVKCIDYLVVLLSL
jgi:hypothetical protein